MNSLRIHHRYHDVIRTIWQKAGKNRFIWAYIQNDLPGESAGVMKRLEHKSYVISHGYILGNNGGNARIWILTAPVVFHCREKYGDPDPNMVALSEKAIQDYREHFKQSVVDNRVFQNSEKLLTLGDLEEISSIYTIYQNRGWVLSDVKKRGLVTRGQMKRWHHAGYITSLGFLRKNGPQVWRISDKMITRLSSGQSVEVTA